MRLAIMLLFAVTILFSLQARAFSPDSPFDPITIVNNGDMGTTEIISTAVDLTLVKNFSMHAMWSGNAVGTLNVQVSNFFVTVPCSGIPDSGWLDYSNSSVAVAGVASQFLWNFSSANYRCMRMHFAQTSGTGVLNIVYGRK